MHHSTVGGDAAGPSAFVIGCFPHILKTTMANHLLYNIDSSTRDVRRKREASARNIVGVDGRLEFSFLAKFTHTACGLMETFGKGWDLGSRERVASNRTSKRG